jgi:outer membrane translocation and assembly module TamA
MSGEQLTGQDTPVVDNEAQNLAPQVTGNPEAKTDGAEGSPESPVPKTLTLTEEELQARIERATAKAAAKAERRAFREATQRLQSQTQQTAPTREAFANDEAFNEANRQHAIREEAKRLLEDQRKAEEAERRQEAFLEKAEKASEKYPDFQMVVSNPALPITDAMAEYIADSDLGADVAYYLGKNPMKAQQIAALSPVKAARELAKLESELAARPKATPSKAPDPIKPVGSRGSSASALPSDDDDISTWMRKEEERVRAKYRR